MFFKNQSLQQKNPFKTNTVDLTFRILAVWNCSRVRDFWLRVSNLVCFSSINKLQSMTFRMQTATSFFYRRPKCSGNQTSSLCTAILYWVTHAVGSWTELFRTNSRPLLCTWNPSLVVCQAQNLKSFRMQSRSTLQFGLYLLITLAAGNSGGVYSNYSRATFVFALNLYKMPTQWLLFSH